MENSKKIVAVLLIGMFLIGGTAYAKGPFTKFGRGVTNILLSPGEIVYQPMKMAQDNNGMIATIGGVPKGIIYFPVRLLLGAYDLVTFLIPYPKDYGYWVEPETLIEGFDQLKYGGTETAVEEK